MAIALFLIHLERKLSLSLLKLNLIVYLSRRRAAKADELIMSGGGWLCEFLSVIHTFSAAEIHASLKATFRIV